jgi:hypothetical protein
MSKTSGKMKVLLLTLMLVPFFSCREEQSPSTAVPTRREAAASEGEPKREPAARAGREEREEEGEAREDDSEEAKEAAEEARMRQRAVEQLQAYQARTCSEAITKITELLQTKKGRWLERNDRGQIPSDLVQTLAKSGRAVGIAIRVAVSGRSGAFPPRRSAQPDGDDLAVSAIGAARRSRRATARSRLARLAQGRRSIRYFRLNDPPVMTQVSLIGQSLSPTHKVDDVVEQWPPWPPVLGVS